MKSFEILTLTLFLFTSKISCDALSPQPRIITDLSIINSNQGVPVENVSINVSPSSPGCPQPVDGYPWLYFGDPEPRCYLASFRGPCPEGEMLVIQPNSLYGGCACDCLSILVNVEYKQVSKSNTSVNRYKTCLNETSKVGPAGQIYDKMEQKCYSFYQQGPCPEGTVIVHSLNEEEKITCKSFCSDLTGNARKIAEESGECLQGMVAGVSKIWTENGCLPGEKYSNILRKCIQDFSGKFNF